MAKATDRLERLAELINRLSVRLNPMRPDSCYAWDVWIRRYNRLCNAWERQASTW